MAFNELQTSNIVVIGTGYVGLPAALMLAKAGHKVVGVDICLLYTSPSPRD